MNNLFKVIDESAFKKILKHNYDNLTIILFTHEANNRYIASISSLSKKFPELYFIYINRDSFNTPKSAIFNILTTTPSFCIYYRRQCVSIVSEQFINLPNIINEILSQIETAKKQLELAQNIQNNQNTQDTQDNYETFVETITPISNDNISNLSDNNNNNEHKAKLVMLKKIYELKKKGYPILSEYTIKSDYEDMVWEYNLHTNPDAVVIAPNNLNDDEVIKQKLQRIAELENMIKIAEKI